MATEISPPLDHGLLEWAEYWYQVSWFGLLSAGLLTALAALATLGFLLLQWKTSTIRETYSEWRTSVELQAVEARNETLRLQQSVQWRRLTDQQKRVLEKELSGTAAPGNFVVYNRDDPEQAQFFMDIVTFLNEHHINHRLFLLPPSATGQFLFPPTGVLSQSQEGADHTFISAFEKAGLITGRLGTILKLFPEDIKSGIVIAPKPSSLDTN